MATRLAPRWVQSSPRRADEPGSQMIWAVVAKLKGVMRDLDQ
jgi:hypothetical protein